MKSLITRSLLLTYAAVGLVSCHSNSSTDSGSTTKSEPAVAEQAPVAKVHDFLKDGNKGVGNIKSFEHQPFNQKLADEGNKLFIVKCTMCHEIKEDKIGPALYGVTKKRTPEWMMNMILTPDQMLTEDADALLLSKSYAGTMTSLGLNPQEATAILEYLRQEDAK
ncbi:cytochrome c [Sphingobacterium faecium]|uniref:c-type cytochrome n=1 Tax=Sphingobacterium faecium TaxID=34087 RepID=UPI003207AA3E